MHEVVTLQFGEAANYLGTHFWNEQEAYFTYDAQQQQQPTVNHDIHFRPGVGANGSETFTPRTVIYDFKSRFGTLRQENELYRLDDEPEAQALANRSASIRRQTQIPQHAYQRALNEGAEPPRLTSANVRYWSDFNRVFYNPKSIAQIYENELNPQQTFFNDWEHGEDLFRSLSRDRDMLDDDLRPLVEECDQMQGVQILTSVDDGWGGFSSKYLDELRDEYSKSCTFVWALNSRTNNMPLSQRRLALANQARCLAAMSPKSSMYIPLARIPHTLPNYVHLHHQALWSTSALQCCALESVTLPSRMAQSSGSQPILLDSLAAALGGDERQTVADLDVRFQLYGIESGMTNGATSKTHDPPAPCIFTPYTATNEGRRPEYKEFAQLNVLRGSHLDELIEQPDPSVPPQSQLRLELPFPILDSFAPLCQDADTPQPHGLSVRASLTKSSITSAWAKHLDAAVRIQIGVDEREAISDILQEVAAAYQGSTYDSGVESEADD